MKNLQKSIDELVLENNKLRKQNDALLKSNSELISFNHVASHDLQDPLRKIQFLISRIFDEKELNLSEKNKDYFKRIQVSANRMQVLINDLIAYSKTSDGSDKFQSINLNSLVENVLNELTLFQTIESTKTTINCDKLPVINGISFQLEQLFTNLILNSIKYCTPGKLPIINITYELVNGTEILSEKSEKQKNYHHITITDNGIGFEQHYAEKIFTLFYRLHDKQSYSGTGIGLTICKKIVENHNGFIAASSQLNHGTSINIYLPST